MAPDRHPLKGVMGSDSPSPTHVSCCAIHVCQEVCLWDQELDPNNATLHSPCTGGLGAWQSADYLLVLWTHRPIHASLWSPELADSLLIISRSGLLQGSSPVAVPIYFYDQMQNQDCLRARVLGQSQSVVGWQRPHWGLSPGVVPANQWSADQNTPPRFETRLPPSPASWQEPSWGHLCQPMISWLGPLWSLSPGEVPAMHSI